MVHSRITGEHEHLYFGVSGRGEGGRDVVGLYFKNKHFIQILQALLKFLRKHSNTSQIRNLSNTSKKKKKTRGSF